MHMLIATMETACTRVGLFTLPHEHIKIHEYVEQLLLKTTWRWTERLLYNQGCKERSTGSKVERQKSDWVRTHALTRRHRKGGRYHGQGDSPWGVRGSSHMLGTSALRSDTRTMSPLSWFENQWDKQEDCKKPRLCKEHTCIHLLTPKTRRMKQAQTAQDSGQCPTSPSVSPSLR